MTNHLFLGGPMHGRLTELTTALVQVTAEIDHKNNKVRIVNYARHPWFYSITGKCYDVYVHGKITDFDSWQVAQLLRKYELL